VGRSRNVILCSWIYKDIAFQHLRCVCGVAEKDSIEKMALSDITFKRDNKPSSEIITKCEKLFAEVVIKKEKEAQGRVDKKKKRKKFCQKKISSIC